MSIIVNSALLKPASTAAIRELLGGVLGQNRRSEWRGLPPGTLPTVVLDALRSMVDLKSEFSLSANERGG